MSNEHTVNPLSIFIVWDQDFSDGIFLADQVYSLLSRSVDNPTERGIGIPVDYVNDPQQRMNFSQNALNLVFILIDDYFIVHKNEWEKYINLLDAEKNELIVIPFAFECRPFDIFTRFNNTNFVVVPTNNKTEYFQFIVSYEVSRAINQINNKTKDINLFLSHNKSTGEVIVEKIRSEILRSTKLNTFYDKHDIPYGDRFDMKIYDSIKESIVIVFLTDGFSSRDWCKREIIAAKENERPMILLDFYEEGEARLFPYLGNVKIISLNPKKIRYYKLLTAILIENIKIEYNSVHTKYLIDLLKISNKNYKIMNQPPELLTVLYHSQSENLSYIYPEPPINNDELEIISKIVDKKNYTTPIMFSTTKSTESLLNKNLKVGLSISYSSDSKRIDTLKIQDIITNIVRYLLVLDSSIYYAGDPNYNENTSFSNILLNIEDKYYNHRNRAKNNLILVLPKYVQKNIKVKQLNYLKQYADIINIEYEGDIDIQKDLFLTRKKLSEIIDFHIIMGGKTSNFEGEYPGIITEFMNTYEEKKPIFLIGGFGGASKIICDIIQGEIHSDLNDKYFYKSLLNIDIGNLNNGLNKEENELLMTTKDADIIVVLLLKGIKEIYK